MKKLEIYVHIPFCVQKCAYCDFLSGVSTREEREAYVEALKRECESYQEEVRDYEVQSIFFGGGTPSVLHPEQIKGILDVISENFCMADDVEITMEMNPGVVDRTRMLQYKKAGIKRLSIGLQSADDKELKLLGRIHTWKQFLVTFQAARDAGFYNINVDLMSAIPGQTLESWKDTLKEVVRLSPEHISAYSLIIEEGTKFGELYGDGQPVDGYPPLPDEDTERSMYEETEMFLKRYGYSRYEISNYAKEGYECRHNIGYWERAPYIGMGVGASSLFEEERFTNLSDRKRYVELWMEYPQMTSKQKKKMQRAEIHKVTVREAQEEFFFLGLRMMQGVSRKEFHRQFGIWPEEIYGKQTERLTEEGLLEKQEDRIRLTKRGIDLSNYAMAQFLQD
nr:radical SAM family heme chaperone HemW [uncultured Sellimonas sp.]